MPAAIDLTGKRAGSLLVKEFSRRTRGTSGQSVKLWKCVCNCGAEMELPTGVLSNRKARGCEFCETFTLKTELEGKMFESVNSGDFVVEEYINSTNVHILFINTGTKIITALKEVRKGSVRDIMHPTVCSVGFFGIGEHLGTTEDGCKNSPAYEVWRGIIRRCYDKNCKSYLRYEDVDVCKEWHNFQNFAEWFYSQKHCEDGFAVDKDLKVIGSRLYSPETCSLVPCEVNSLFTGSNENLKERNLPKGVHFCKDKTLYIAQIHKGELTKAGNKKQTYLGQFNSKVEALSAYKVAKEDHVKEVANRFKNVLDLQVYNNLMEFEVDVSQWIKE